MPDYTGSTNDEKIFSISKLGDNFPRFLIETDGTVRRGDGTDYPTVLVFSGGSDTQGVFDATNYGLTSSLDDSYASTNTVALQDAVDAMVAWMLSNSCGATLLIPAGRYVFNGGIVFPSVNSTPITVIAWGAKFRYPSTGSVGENTSMFSTPLPTDSSDAEVQNDLRNRWRWFGGDFDARSRSNSTVFELNAASRMVIRDVYIANVSVGIRARFCLHLRIQDSQFSACYIYAIQVEEDDDWAGSTPSNAAGHGVIIDNIRVYQATGSLAGVRVAHTEFIVQNSTFEGYNPVTNIDFYSANTSCLTASVHNLHCENTPTDSHVRIDTLHGFDVDFNHVIQGIRINALAATIINVGRLGYPTSGPESVVTNTLKTTTEIRWRFLSGAGTYGGLSILQPNLWVDGIIPPVFGILFGGTGNSGKTASLYMGTQRLFISNGKLMIDDGAGGSATVVGTQS